MKKLLLFLFLLASSTYAISQSVNNFPGDADKAYGLIKNGAFKNGYNFFVYDNSTRPTTDFKVYLMTPDSALQKKYTARPYDRGQIGVARAEQLQFRTKEFTSGKTRPVKLEANPQAIIYIFHKK